jgi:Tol biopolymer transport system component
LKRVHSECMSADESRIAAPLFALELALALIVALVVWRVAHTPKPLLASEANAFTRIAWINQSGAVLDAIDLQGHYVAPCLSRNGRSLLLTRLKPGGRQIWELSTTHRKIRLLPLDAVQSAFGIWSPSGERFAFSMWHEERGEIFDATVAGCSKERLLDEEGSNVPEDWSPDGQWLAFTRTFAGKSQIWFVQSKTRKAHLFLESKASLSEIRFSPDGRWVALTVTTEDGEEVYGGPINLTRSAPVLRENELIRISPDGGHSPQWGSGSAELFYIASDGTLMILSGDPAKASAGTLRRLFGFSSVGRPQYQYRFGGYCTDRLRNAFIAALTRAAL